VLALGPEAERHGVWGLLGFLGLILVLVLGSVSVCVDVADFPLLCVRSTSLYNTFILRPMFAWVKVGSLRQTNRPDQTMQLPTAGMS
jgi:hypothetical protein